jgi:hypothetical protein
MLPSTVVVRNTGAYHPDARPVEAQVFIGKEVGRGMLFTS